ncbi:MAG: L-threonylcarbamoyladenylate synthase [bacterium]
MTNERFSGEIRKAVDVLRKDGLVIFPTDTVYGLAASANSKLAVEKIYKLKQRPKDKPFIIFVPDVDFLKKLKIKITPKIEKLLDAFWPGAVTFIFKKIPLNPPFSKGEMKNNTLFSKGERRGLKKIAVRIPEHPVVLAVLKEFNGSLAVTSANVSGKESPFDFNQIEAGILENVELAISAGRCPFSRVSTIVNVSEKELKILREGAIPAEEILKVWTKLN